MNPIFHGFYAAAAMLWETLWALVLGFSLSALLQVFVRREQMEKHFGRANLRSMGLATFFGAVSSSCSYAAATAAKTAFKKGSALAVALAFMFASTNLVIELSAVLWLLMGWVFVLAEFVGAFVLIGIMWTLLALTLPKGLEESAREHTEPGMKSCCHSMSHDADGPEPLPRNLRRKDTWLAIANSFWMEVSMLWKEIVAGFLIAGFLMAFVPMHWWQSLFISSGPTFLRLLENAVIGPLIAVLSFVCSIGNIPLAGWLWANGISFGGVLAFIYADLIVIPLILIYRKYYGGLAAVYITLILFCSMVLSGILVGLLFNALGLVPQAPRPPSAIQDAQFQWNYTTWLNLAALCVVAWFLRVRWRQKPTVAPQGVMPHGA